ncbi:MAG: hypothetical protein ACI9W4_000853 [Rhodothermales bacterium]|jgi:hypothetical protein
MSAQQKLNAVFLVCILVSTIGAALWLAPVRPQLAPWESTSLAAAGGFVFGLLMVIAASHLLKAKGLFPEG